jgi:hypothetical protein
MRRARNVGKTLSEYDFTKGIRGKYAKRYHQASNVIILEPDLAKKFPNSQAVNRALRSLERIQRGVRHR